MRKRIFSLIILILVAVCGVTLVSCGENSGENVSIYVSDGLDTQLSTTLKNDFSDELRLSSSEKDLFIQGKTYLGLISSQNAVSLIVGDEEFGSREITVQIGGFFEGMGKEVFFSTDSNCISIPEKVEYLSNGKAKVKITANSSGTAEVFVKTGQFGKTTSFVVKCFSKLENFSAKTNAIIYLEKGKTLEINPENYFNFYPLESNMRDLEFFDGDVSLTNNGKTILSTSDGEGVTGVIESSREISVRAIRLVGTEALETISVVVVDSLESMGLKKTIYDNSGIESYVELGETLTVIQNVTSKEGVSYGVRKVYVTLDCDEKDLEISAKAFSKGQEIGIYIIPTDLEQITQNNFSTSKFKNLVDTSREQFSTYVFEFEFKYEGYSEYDVKFTFKVGEYEYSESLKTTVEFKTASSLIELKKLGETKESEEFLIYDYYSGIYGTGLTISIGRSDLFSQSTISLEFEDADLGKFILMTRTGTQKQTLTFSSGETFYVKANLGVTPKTYNVKAKISFTFEGVDFVTEKTYNFNVQNSPTNVKLISGIESINNYNFDLNTSGKVLGQEVYNSRKTLELEVCGFAGSASLGALSDFTVISSSGILQVIKDGEKIKLTAIDTGFGSFEVVLGNGVKITFNYNVIQSVSNAEISFPEVSQNSSLTAVLSNYVYNEKTYDQYAIVKTNSAVPLLISASGDFTYKLKIDGTVIETPTNGKLIFENEFLKKELTVEITFNKVNESGEIVSVTENANGMILMSAITEISSLSISTSKGSTNFSLYDYTSVGYFSKNLATANIYLNVVPTSIKQDIFDAVVWTTNVGELAKVENVNSDVYTCDIFTFEFFKKGENAGMGIITCKVNDGNLFDDDGNLRLGRVTLSASVSRTKDVENSSVYKNINFNVKQANKVDVISVNKTQINLDPYSNNDQVLVSIFPLEATNKNWNYVFIPATEGIDESDISITKIETGLKIELKNNDVAGKGTLRLIALDSYSTVSDYSTFVDISVNINDGSEAYPYYIKTADDIEKLVNTNFEKYYIVSGNFDLSDYDWSTVTLSGTIKSEDGKSATFTKQFESYSNTTNEVYIGLFKEITGRISGIKLDVLFNLDFSENTGKTIYIGGFAGNNRGTIENVSVEIKNGSSISVGNNTLYFGGVVGVNEGTILNNITASSKLTMLVSGKFEIGCISDSKIFVGGAVGQNNGTIKRTIEAGLVEFNNSFATANVNMTISCDSVNTQSCVGGIVGSSTNLLSNLESVGTITASNFDNVGGVVGNNSGTIENCLSQAVVVGHDNVGGAVGTNSGTISGMIVESLEKKSGVTLISGNNNVGGIVGNMTGGSLGSSSFISYLSDTNAVDISSSNQYGFIVGAQTDGTIDYDVAIADGNGASQFEITADNYAIYKKGNDNPTKSNGVAENKLKTEIKEVEGFEFIFLPMATINMVLTEEGEKFELLSSSPDGKVAFYIFLHDKDGDYIEKQISSMITTSLGNRYLIESSNSEILAISNGKLVPKSIGETKLVVSSPYVTGSQEIYVKVISFANNISVYLDSTKATEIENASTVVFDAELSKILYLSLLDKYNLKNFNIPTDIKMLFKIVVGGETKYIKPGEEILGLALKLVQNDPETYQISVDGNTGEYNVTILPYIEFVGEDGKTYFKILDLEVDEKSKKEINSTLVFENTTKGINISKNKIETEPYYVTDMNVSLDSIKENEKVTISIKELGENGNILVDPGTLYLELIVQCGEDSLTNKSGESYGDTLSFHINCKDNSNFTIKFKLDENGKTISSAKTFKITITASNGVSSSMTITYQPQSVISVYANLFPTISKDEEKYNFSGRFSYIPSGVIIPGQHSLLELSITPYFTYFKTVEIVNAEGNEYDLAFDLFDRVLDAPLSGAKRITNGISIPKSLIQNGKFYVRAFADQRMSDNSQVALKVIFRDENGNQIGDEVLLNFFVERLPGVILTVDGVSSGNDENNPVKLAQGVSYDLDVDVKGFTFGTFTTSGSIITDGQVCFELSGNASGFVSIVKNDDGTYKLVIKDALPSGERTLMIKSYGVDIDGEKSQEAILYIELEQFVVKENNLSDIVSNVFNNIYASAIGNSYTFEISLNSDILIYNKSNETIRNNVLKFLSDLSVGNETKLVWLFKESTGTWNTIIGNKNFKDGVGNTKVYTTSKGGFKISYNETTKKIVIKFMKVHTPSAPDLEIKFSAEFYYNDNGIPSLYTGDDNGKNLYTLSQEFTFDISEKTSLRNPYPIYSYEDMLDMREGNYYILMNDITLPDDFTPIETLIGGFNGNNYKITLPREYSLKSEETKSIKFGLFKITAQNTLLQNIVIFVNENTNFNFYDYTSVTFGLLVGENNGKITNCSVQGEQYAIMNLNLFGIPDSTEVGNQVGGLVGINNGDITNSHIETGLSLNATNLSTSGYLPANLGGITAINGGSGSIASSYVKARIENNTAGSVSAITGGVVGVNQLGGTIFTTYITSGYTDADMFPDEVAGVNIIYSTASASAFVYENYGEISNCYSNIPVKTNESASGFVFNNQSEGKITHCYSTSALESSAKNGVFIGILTGISENSILNSGELEACFALESGNFNKGLGSNKGVEGLEILQTEDHFSKIEKFEKYAFSNTADKTEGVWFWANGSLGEVDFCNEKGEYLTFSTKAPQLVSPNILTYGHKKLVDTYFDSATETTTYIYEDEEKNPEGSKFNPYIISSQDDLEFLISASSGFTSGVIIKDLYCRLIGDIIYETSTVSSGLYQYTFLGNLEGNGYTIGNYVLDSGAKLDNAGFFGTIGLASQKVGSIKNLTFAPRYISLANCNNVGAVAGTIYGATLVNIVIDGATYAVELEGVTVLGKNAVGGICGVAEGEFNFNNIISSISVNASYRASLNNHPIREYLNGNSNQVSYAGMIAGIVNGYGRVVFASVHGNNVSAAENAGLMFGYIGKNVIVQNLEAIGAQGQKVKADVYGGVVAGHNLGTIEDVKIVGDDGSAYLGFFGSENFSPNAIGNIAGYMSNGTIKNVYVNTKLKAKIDVGALGGAVGLMSAGRIENVIVIGEIIGGNKIGGLVGQIKNLDSSSYKISIIDSFHSGEITSTSSEVITSVGTVVGYISSYFDGMINCNVVSSASDVNSKLTKTINIILTSAFKDDVQQKLSDGSYLTKIVINNYSISESLQVWYGIGICEDKTTYKKSLLSNESLDIYKISSDNETVYVPLSPKYTLNGK